MSVVGGGREKTRNEMNKVKKINKISDLVTVKISVADQVVRSMVTLCVSAGKLNSV
jgi:hypothetical protein